MITINEKTRRNIGGFALDATIQEDYQSDVNITEFPVEFGASINDHRIILPQKYIVTGRVSDTPFKDDGQWLNSADETRSAAAFSTFRDIQTTGEPIDVQSGLKLYENMVIQSIRCSQDPATARTFDFTAILQEIIITETEVVQITVPEEGATEEQASQTVNQGEAQAEELDEERETSVLLKLVDIF